MGLSLWEAYQQSVIFSHRRSAQGESLLEITGDPDSAGLPSIARRASRTQARPTPHQTKLTVNIRTLAYAALVMVAAPPVPVGYKQGAAANNRGD